MALVASFVATRIYYASLEQEEDAVMDESVAWVLVSSLTGAWLTFFVFFLLLIKSTFWRTFFSLQTGYDICKNKFINGETDEKKMIVGRTLSATVNRSSR